MFGLFESSRQKGQPIELYHFRYGTKPGAFFAQTNAERQVFVDGVTYIPTPITRSNIVVTGTLDRAQLDVMSSRNNPVGELFRVYPPAAPVNLRIYEGHLGDDDFKLIWAGRVTSVSFDQSQLKLICQPISARTLNVGLKRHWQVGCPHVLYGPRCKVPIASYLLDATVTAVSGSEITFGAGWNGAIDPAKYLGGLVMWPSEVVDADMRTIIKIVDSQTVRVSYVPRGVVAGSAVQVAPGCDHTLGGDCTNLFHNSQNYGGCPFIPFKNPVNNFSTFY
jgi:hypothetical protein